MIQIKGHEQAGRRPVLILSEDVFNKHSGTVIAVVLASKPPSAGFPLTLELSSHGLPKKSWVKISQIRTLSILRLGKKVGQATSEEVETVLQGLDEILGR